VLVNTVSKCKVSSDKRNNASALVIMLSFLHEDARKSISTAIARVKHLMW
jgi:hypothetical protein